MYEGKCKVLKRCKITPAEDSGEASWQKVILWLGLDFDKPHVQTYQYGKVSRSVLNGGEEVIKIGIYCLKICIPT